MFRYTDVARIVKDTMHNYILEDNRLSCSIIQHETLPPNLFRKPQLKNLQKEYADKYAMFKADCRFSSAETRDKFWQLQGKKAEKCAAVGIDVVEGRF
ncbi:MAG: uncharacterized protein KVP18_001455 [Porospora cf. gigantea A]|nr:MAG: hypothetical protein KVP18_001455 [Porospora cf. gigantea A]